MAAMMVEISVTQLGHSADWTQVVYRKNLYYSWYVWRF